MQPVAIAAIVVGVSMVIGVSATLVVARRGGWGNGARTNRWQVHGSVPLAGAGLAFGVISREGGQTPATHDALFAVTTALLLGAVLCALAGAATATRGRRGDSGA